MEEQDKKDLPLYYPMIFCAGMIPGLLLGLASTPYTHGAFYRELTLCAYIWGLMALGISSRWGCLTSLVFIVFLSKYQLPGLSALNHGSQIGLVIQIFLSCLWLRWRTMTLVRLLSSTLFTLALVIWPVACDPDPISPSFGPSLIGWAVVYTLFLLAQLGLHIIRGDDRQKMTADPDKLA